jgi:uncharacterized protein (UPF0333 family)
MNKKSQAAMEFLMTYGWALLVILLVLAALAYFGMLNPDRFLPDKITVSDNRIQLISTQSNGLIIKNAGSDTFYNLQINMTNHDCKISMPSTIAPGEIKRVIILCSDPVPSNGRLKGDIRINYSTITYGEIMQKTAMASYAVRGNYFSSKGLVGHWPLDNGNANDYSNFGNNGAISGAVQGAGKLNEGYIFDGIDDYIQMTGYKGISGTNPRSISAWFKSTTITGPAISTIIAWGSVGTGTVYQVALWYSTLDPTSNGKMGAHTVGDVVITTEKYDDNLWHNVVVTTDSDAYVNVYIDGALKASRTINYFNTGSTADFAIGRRLTDNTEPFKGTIDEVMVFNRILTADEAKALYQSGK